MMRFYQYSSSALYWGEGSAVDKIVKDGIDKADKGLICFSNLTVAVEKGSQVSCSRNVADLTLRNILSVTEL